MIRQRWPIGKYRQHCLASLKAGRMPLEPMTWDEQRVANEIWPGRYTPCLEVQRAYGMVPTCTTAAMTRLVETLIQRPEWRERLNELFAEDAA